MAKYLINGSEYPSVTTICGLLDKPFLKQWAVNCAIKKLEPNIGQVLMAELLVAAKQEWQTISDEAKDIGSQVHDLIHKYIKYGKDAVGVIPEQVSNAFLAFLDWEKTNRVEWIESEKVIVNPNACYAGTLDAIAKISGQVYCIDFKSSKGFYDGYDMQIAAYRQARQYHPAKVEIQNEKGEVYTQEYPEVNIEGMGILRIDKDTGIPEWKDYTKKFLQAYQAFEDLLSHYYHYKKRRLKNNPRVK